MFTKILIANRGEIALRVARTCQVMGIRAATVYSEADRTSPHVAAADEAYPLPGVAALDTYLNIPRLVEIATRCGAQAVHPGYGFLAENPAFVEACEAAGLVFIGPSAQAMQALGNKITARRLAEEAGVPVVPGWSGEASQLPEAARRLGYPVLVKAAAGGGGKGMRLVAEPAELLPAVEAARREAAGAFGDATVYLEKYLPRPRHIEIQIFADRHGQVVHLGERECSIQRRHQKILEESPSVALDEALRRRMGQAAVALARHAGYFNAGTVEFMLDEASGQFYFLEVNKRLQVEHPVTEMVLGQDLVRAQILVAAGQPLPWRQEDLVPRGHALECRLYAEDPVHFYPSTGTVRVHCPPQGPGLRVDSGIEVGSEVTVHYDPLLAKILAWGADRAEAFGRMAWALRHYVILGLQTNLELLQFLLDHPEVRAGRLHTHFLEEFPFRPQDPAPPPEAVAAAALSLRAPRRGDGQAPAPARQSPWTLAGPWRMG
jgi:3-methylcrotonyl-CoA carboxylase alpha subunit